MLCKVCNPTREGPKSLSSGFLWNQINTWHSDVDLRSEIRFPFESSEFEVQTENDGLAKRKQEVNRTDVDRG